MNAPRRLRLAARSMNPFAHLRTLALPVALSVALTLALSLAPAVGPAAGLAPVAQAQGFFDQLLVSLEIAIGESVAEDVIAEYGPPISLPPRQQRRVDAAFANIVAQASRRKELEYSLKILDSDVVNAFAAPGGHIFVTTGLLQHVGDDIDALANVLGHEVAHVELKHGMNSLTRQLGLGLLLQLIFGGSDETFRTVVAVAAELTRRGWSREQEHASDDLGQRLAAAAGYDPYGMVRFFDVLLELQGAELPFLEFLSTHPLTTERLERARARAGSLQPSPATR